MRPEALLAASVAAVGLLSIVSALTPEMAGRSDLVRGVLPPGVPTAARLLALAFGIALVWLSRSLAQRRRRAWQLAVALVVASAVAHMAKGLDFEEATASLLLLAALVRYRARFAVPGDPATLRPLAGTAFALAAAGAFLALYALDRLNASDDVYDLVVATAGLLAFRALYLWLRPLGERVRQSGEQRGLARALVQAHGRDSLSFFALRRDKSYFFSATGGAFLAYRVVGGAALVSGDPVGEQAELRPLLEEFRRVAHASGWRLAILGARGELLPLYRSLGFKSIKLGDEAVVRPAEFSLEGRAIRKVRQSVHRLCRAGYRVRILPAADVPSELRQELRAVSDEWRGSSPERGFTMTMDDLFGEPGTVFAVAEDAAGGVGGFLHLVPAPAGGGWSLSAMRRRPATPNGLMEFLIVEATAWARAEAIPELSLNFCVFTDQLEGRGALGAVLRRLDRLFQLERLLVFNRKFFPEWRPRYLCIERLADFPLVGLAYLRAESLLTPPGPWTRAAVESRPQSRRPHRRSRRGLHDGIASAAWERNRC